MVGVQGLNLRHFLISAKMGYTSSLEMIKRQFKVGHATKSQYAEALKCYQNAMEEMKSPEREEAKFFVDRYHQKIVTVS